MSDRNDRKYTSRSSKTKERHNTRAERYHGRVKRDDERHRHRETHSHRSDDPRDISDTRSSRHMHFEHNVKGIGKSHQLNEGMNRTTDVSATKETSTTAARHDAEFNWEEHRSILDAIFFQDEDMIKKGSVEYDEFWVFLQKYQAFGRKQLVKINSSLHSAEHSFQSNKFNLPEKYDKRYRVNVSLVSKDVQGLLHRRQRDTLSLTEEKVATFRSILLHYVDFLQKQKFARLVKVKHDQQKLPIYEHREEIVDAITSHQVVVIAGDTGCGKSTQVPQYLLSAGYTHIACTQPRRIACISLSRRVAYETLNEYGSEVAYQVVFFLLIMLFCLVSLASNCMFVKYVLLWMLISFFSKNRLSF